MGRWLDYWRSVRGRVVLDRSFARAMWVVPWLVVRARLRRPAASGARIAFHPHPAGPWYTLPLALGSTGVRRARRADEADVVVAFDDQTRTRPAALARPALNANATDIGKTRVGEVFEAVFGYPLSVDPLTHHGPMVEKSDGNGVHDGRIVEGPLADARPGMAYQRLVDTQARPGVTEELRCTCVGGAVSAVVRKEKLADQRFAARYLLTRPVAPDAALSTAERERLARFLHAMGLDFGSIDVLRDRVDGRIYVVDVNKTCMPVLAMNWRDLEATLATIGRDAERLILRRAASR